MRELEGDIWELRNDGWVGITINGTLKKDGKLVMGAGVAKQAKDRFPNLDTFLGYLVSRQGLGVLFLASERLIAIPTKHNWYDPTSDQALIEQGVETLSRKIKNHSSPIQARLPIYLPRLGCGNGKLDWQTEVRPIMEKYLDDQFVVVTSTLTGESNEREGERNAR